MIPSATEIGASTFFTQLFFFPQVTMGRDHVLISNALSAFANGKELLLQIEIAMSETPRWLNLVPRVPLRSDGLELTRRYGGPGSETLSALRVSRLGGANPYASKSRWAKRRGD
jgi:hypothetical protein